MDLYHADRVELIAIVMAQREENAALTQRCVDLTQQVTELQATVERLTEELGRLGDDRAAN